MNRRLLVVLAALAGIVAVVLLLPVGPDEAEPDAGSSMPVLPSAPVTTSLMPAVVVVPQEDLPPQKAAAMAALAEHRMQPFNVHATFASKQLLILGNMLWTAGDEAGATQAREAARLLRKAARPDGTSKQQDAGLAREGEALKALVPRYPDGEAARILLDIQASYDLICPGGEPLHGSPLHGGLSAPRGVSTP